MKGFFSTDGALYKFITRLWDLICLNFWWSLCVPVVAMFLVEFFLYGGGVISSEFPLWIKIPVCIIAGINFGPATTALYSVGMKMVDENESYVTRMYFTAFKENFKQGLIVGIFNLVAVYVVYLDIQIFEGAENNPIVFLIMAFVFGFYFLFTFLYAYPQIARYQNGTIRILKNSFRIALKYWKFSIGMFFTILLMGWLGYDALAYTTSGNTVWSIILLLYLLMGVSVLVFTLSWLALTAFRKLEKEQKEENA